MEQQDMMNAMHQHINTITGRLINAEMALDVALGLLFDKNEGFQDEFTQKFEARIKELNEAREAAQTQASIDIQSSAPPAEEPSPIITP